MAEFEVPVAIGISFLHQLKLLGSMMISLIKSKIHQGMTLNQSSFSKLSLQSTLVLSLLLAPVSSLHHHITHETIPVITAEEIANPQTGPVIGVFSQELYGWLIRDLG